VPAWGVAVALAVAALALSVASDVLEDSGAAVTAAELLSRVVNAIAMLAFATVGAFVVARRPETAIGWAFLALGSLLAVRYLAAAYATFGLLTRPGSLPGADLAWSIGEVFAMAPFALFAVSMLLFPNGRLPSVRWRRVPWIVGIGSVAGGLGLALRPGALDPPLKAFVNPLGLGAERDPFEALSALGWLLMAAGMLATGVALVQRLRRARGVERQQLKWVAYAGGLYGAIFVVISATFFAELRGDGIDALRHSAIGLGYAALPIAAGFAILRYRLYDIDVVINRTLVYTALTATLASTYLASVLLLQLVLSPLTEQSGLAIAGSTLAVAGLFQPARLRIQAAVDRRFFRRRYDAARTLERFGASLRDEVDLDGLGIELRAVVGETMQPAHVSLWLREARAKR
jgi:hypothetical protein